MNILARFTIAQKLIGLLVIAILAITGLAISNVIEKRTSANRFEDMVAVATFIPDISNVIHEFQKERGNSAGFIGSGGNSNFMARLYEQRDLTNAMVTRLQGEVAEREDLLSAGEVQAEWRRVQQKFGQLRAFRSNVDSLSFTVPQMATAYTETIRSLFDYLYAVQQTAVHPSFGERYTAIVALMELKERAGIERAMGASGFAAGQFTSNGYNRFLAMGAEQVAYANVFREYGLSGWVAMLDNLLASKVAVDVDALRTIVAAAGPMQPLNTETTGAQWFDIITKKIDALKELENTFLAEVVTLAGEAAGRENSGANLLVVENILLVLFLVGVGIALARSISKPLDNMMKATGKIADGDLETEIPHTNYAGEIGRLSRALETFRGNLLENEILRQKTLEEEQRRLEMEAAQQRRAEEREKEQAMRKVQEEIERSAAISAAIIGLADEVEKNISSAILEVEATASEAAATSEQLKSFSAEVRSKTLSADAMSQNSKASVSEVMVASQILTESIQHVHDMVANSSGSVNEAHSKTTSIKGTISGLNDAAARIEQVVALIEEISEQTNLLALNATIEAARAGEAGKGFAVVANEVKSLATQTARSTDEIKGSIHEMQDIVQRVVDETNLVGGAIDQVQTAFASMEGATRQQEESTRDISVRINGTNESISGASDLVRRIADEATEVAGMSEQLQQSATMVSRRIIEMGQQVKSAMQLAVDNVLSRTTVLPEQGTLDKD